MSEVQQTYSGSPNGTVKIADEVIAIIAGTSALEVDGVAPVDPADVKGRKNLTRGVRIGVNDGQVNIALNVSVKQGYKIVDVTQEAQHKVKTAIETMTGMSVSTVDVSVLGLKN
jgi:uncharacterized alkaline shock family protein YloU